MKKARHHAQARETVTVTATAALAMKMAVEWCLGRRTIVVNTPLSTKPSLRGLYFMLQEHPFHLALYSRFALYLSSRSERMPKPELEPESETQNGKIARAIKYKTLSVQYRFTES